MSPECPRELHGRTEGVQRRRTWRFTSLMKFGDGDSEITLRQCDQAQNRVAEVDSVSVVPVLAERGGKSECALGEFLCFGETLKVKRGHSGARKVGKLIAFGCCGV